MSKNIRITENQLKRIINNVISEQIDYTQYYKDAKIAEKVAEELVGATQGMGTDSFDFINAVSDIPNITVFNLVNTMLPDKQFSDKFDFQGLVNDEFNVNDEKDKRTLKQLQVILKEIGVTMTIGTDSVTIKAAAVQPAAAQKPAAATAGATDANTFLDSAGLACVKSIKGAVLKYYAPDNPTIKTFTAITKKGHNEFVLVTFPDGKPLKSLVVTKDKQGYAYGSTDTRGAQYQNKWVSIGCDGSSIKIDLPNAQVNESIKKEINRFADFAFYNKEKFLIKPKIKTYLNEQLSLDGASGGDVSGSKTTGQTAQTKQTGTGTASTAEPVKKSQVYPAYSLDDVRNRKGMLYLGLKDNKGVGELQHFLNIPITNDFDAATKSAVQDFQRKNNLTADGIVGKKTITAIETSKAQKTSDEMKRRGEEFLAGRDAQLASLTQGIKLGSSSTGLRSARASGDSQVTDTPTGGPTNVTPVGPDIDQQRADAGGYLSDADKKAQAEKRAAEIQQELDSPGSKLFRANWNTNLNFRDPATRRVIVWKGDQLSSTDLEYLNQHMAKGGYVFQRFRNKGDGDGKYVWKKS